jgi:hypothetical protein
MGAASFTGVPRKVFVFGNDPQIEDKHAHMMVEVRDKQAGIQYVTKAVADPQGIQKSPIVQIEWGREVERDADEVINAPKQKEKTVLGNAANLIKGALRNGEVKKSALDLMLKENGIDADKLDWTRLKKRIGADSRLCTGTKAAGWVWFLPAPEQTEFDHV